MGHYFLDTQYSRKSICPPKGHFRQLFCTICPRSSDSSRWWVLSECLFDYRFTEPSLLGLPPPWNTTTTAVAATTITAAAISFLPSAATSSFLPSAAGWKTPNPCFYVRLMISWISTQSRSRRKRTMIRRRRISGNLEQTFFLGRSWSTGVLPPSLFIQFEIPVVQHTVVVTALAPTYPPSPLTHPQPLQPLANSNNNNSWWITTWSTCVKRCRPSVWLASRAPPPTQTRTRRMIPMDKMGLSVSAATRRLLALSPGSCTF